MNSRIQVKLGAVAIGLLCAAVTRPAAGAMANGEPPWATGAGAHASATDTNRPVGNGQQANPIWNLDRIDQHNLPLNHTYTYPNIAKGVQVWVLGDGIRSTSKEFWSGSFDSTSRVECGGDWEAVPYGSCIGQDPGPHHGSTGYATSWAGTIAGLSVGVAKGVTVYNVRVWDGIAAPDAATFVDGINLVTQQQELDPTTPLVGLLPWGDAWTGADGDAIEQAIADSASTGVLWVVGMGDRGTNPCPTSPVLNNPNVITVGLTDQNDEAGATHGGNHGPCQDVYAPGEDIVTASGTSDSQLVTDSGSASAAAHVAGAAAILRGQHPYWSAAELKQKMLDATTPDVVRDNPGDGTPNALLYVTRPNKSCYSNNVDDTQQGVPSDNYSDAPELNSSGAADFTLAVKCTIEAVATTGDFDTGSAPILSVNVIFYKNHKGKPGAIINEQDQLRFTDADGAGSLAADIQPVTLRAGSYFVAFVANTSLEGDYWNWNLSGNQLDALDMWVNSGGGNGICHTWKTVVACTGYGNDYMVTLWR